MLSNTFQVYTVKCHKTKMYKMYSQPGIPLAFCWQCSVSLLNISPQKFRRVRKEDAGEYYCQAKNDAGHAQCPPQMMEVCECLNSWVSVLTGRFWNFFLREEQSLCWCLYCVWRNATKTRFKKVEQARKRANFTSESGRYIWPTSAGRLGRSSLYWNN